MKVVFEKYVLKLVCVPMMLLVFVVNGQTQAGFTSVKVSGTATRMVKPDKAVINVAMSVENIKSEVANDQAQEKVLSVQGVLKKHGLPDSLLKISSIAVRFNKSYNAQRPDVYVASFNGKIEIPANGRMITALIESLETATGINVNVQFDFYESTKTKVSAELLKEALTSARERAQVIAGTLNKSIINVSNVSYGYSKSVEPPVYRGARREMTLAADVGIDITIDERMLQESVEMEFVLQ
ncbi:MAG: SIMPL domain-containing protein [Cyclobacteriaceae bacterium]